jgi:transcriptional regulator with XRE-family HTH domain
MSINIGAVIQRRRKQLKITQPHLAELANVNINTIYRIERDEANPTMLVLKKIADVLGMELKLEVKKLND